MSNSREVEKSLICMGVSETEDLKWRIYANSSRKETKKVKCTETKGAGF